MWQAGRRFTYRPFARRDSKQSAANPVLTRFRLRSESDADEIVDVEQISRGLTLLSELVGDEARDGQHSRVARSARSSRSGAARAGCFELQAEGNRMDADVLRGVNER